MGRAAVRLRFGLLLGVGVLSITPAAADLAPLRAAETRCDLPVLLRDSGFPGGPASPAGTSHPWSFQLGERQPDPDHVRRLCDTPVPEPQLRLPLWDGPDWGLPSLGSFV